MKKIRGSNYENVKKLNTGILLDLRNFWDSNSGILKNAEPDPLTLGFLYIKKTVYVSIVQNIANFVMKPLQVEKV